MGLILKKIPKSVQEAQGRFVGMEKVDQDKGKVIEYGDVADSVTSAIAKAVNLAYISKVSAYNMMKKDLDEAKNDLEREEKELVSLANRVLSSARGKFGFDSNEVETLGGKRSSDRKSPKRKGGNNPA